MTTRPYSRPLTVTRDIALAVTGDALNISSRLALACNETPFYDALELDGFTAHRITAVMADYYPNESERN
jgi:hypothetical protein